MRHKGKGDCPIPSLRGYWVGNMVVVEVKWFALLNHPALIDGIQNQGDQ